MSAAITQSDVQAFAPELSVLSAGAWTDILAYVNELDLTVSIYPEMACPSVPGESAQVDRIAKIYLAAHIGTLTRLAGGGTAGPVTSSSAGGLRRSFGLISMATGSALGSTRYGQMYLDILSMTQAHGPLVI